MIARSALILAGLLLASAPGLAAGVSGHLDDLESAMNARRDALAPDPAAKKIVRRIDKGLKILAKPSTAKAYANEVKAASKVAKILEKKLAAETELLGRMEEARDAYRVDLETARAILRAWLAVPGKTDKGQKRAEKNLARADQALEAADAAPNLSKELKQLSKAAKALADQLRSVGTGESATWVMSDLGLAPAGEGPDLDGDGTPDNQLATLGALLSLIDPTLDLDAIDAMIEENLSQAGQVAIIQMWGVDDWNGDDEVLTGLMNAADTDGDPSDNYSGTETFDATAGLGQAPDGHPLLRADTDLGTGGAYSVEYTGHAVEIGGFQLPGTAVAVIEGTATPARNSGTIGVAIPVDTLVEFLTTQGFEIPPAVAPLLALAADLDMDGDGKKESMSAAFLFDSVPATVE